MLYDEEEFSYYLSIALNLVTLETKIATLGPVGKTCGLVRRGGIISCLHHPDTQPADRLYFLYFFVGTQFLPQPNPKQTSTKTQPNLNPTSTQP